MIRERSQDGERILDRIGKENKRTMHVILGRLLPCCSCCIQDTTRQRKKKRNQETLDMMMVMLRNQEK